MRLIDADKFEADVLDHITVKAVSRMVAILEGQPTVDAIPIEWIKKYGVVKNEIVHTALENVLYWLIKDWEKENGRE